MMKIVMLAGLVLIVGVAGILAYAATLPNTFRVSRTITINAPPEKIFPLNELRTMNQWNPFVKQDPGMEIKYSGPPSGKGAGFSWDSTGRGGKGSMETIDAASPTRVTLKLDMERPMEGHNSVVFALQPNGGSTEVNWTMAGPYPYINRVFGTIFNMDKMIGGAFDSGLSDLKAIAEK
jgi:hypothetical protein